MAVSIAIDGPAGAGKSTIAKRVAEEIQSILEVKERTAKSYIKFMREKEIILKSSDNQSYYVIGNF